MKPKSSEYRNSDDAVAGEEPFVRNRIPDGARLAPADDEPEDRRLSAIGRLAGGIAHDFNNILQGILGKAELLKIKTAGRADDFVEQQLSDIVALSKRAAALTDRLLAFAQKGKYRNIPVDVHDLIGDVAAGIEAEDHPHVGIKRLLNASASVVLGDPGQLQDTFYNLARNALDAMPDGGLLVFSTRKVNLGSLQCMKFSETFKPGAYIQISIIDTGRGIDERVRPHIFEPFFTTKEIGTGSGLGLPAVYGCVRNHGGAIEVDSTPGAGSAFVLYLPLFEKAQASVDTDTNLPFTPARTGANILLVDDEEVMCDMGSNVLRALGYRVSTCMSGKNAIEHYKKFSGEIDLVITDMAMPEMSGRELYYNLRTVNPAVRVLFSSGYRIEEIEDEIAISANVGFLQKPFGIRELAGKVTAMLGVTER